jgi:uncharacterized protein
MKSYAQLLLVLILSLQALNACSSQPVEPTMTPLSTAVPTITSTLAIPAIPSSTGIPFSSPTPGTQTPPAQPPSVTPTRTFVDEELYLDHPLSIERLRLGQYPGSTIALEQELAPGEGYRRYYVSYRSEGLRIYALMTVPDSDGPDNGWPVVIFNHGYIPPDSYRTTERYEEYIDGIARNGYIVFRPDYRGHDLSDGDARGAYGFPDYTIDVLNAVASIKKYVDADPEHIGMWGHSMGGFLTLRSMVVSRDVKIGVIWAGVVAPYPDLINRWPQYTPETPSIANDWRTSFSAIYGTPAQNPAFWDAISANSYLTELSGSIQLQHGTGDLEVPVEFSISLYERLSNADIPVELYTYENDDHNLTNSFSIAMRRTIETFNIYLKE